jgi:hypothetical protein
MQAVRNTTTDNTRILFMLELPPKDAPHRRINAVTPDGQGRGAVSGEII